MNHVDRAASYPINVFLPFFFSTPSSPNDSSLFLSREPRTKDVCSQLALAGSLVI